MEERLRTDPKVLAKLDELRQSFSLDKLYFIGYHPPLFLFGARAQNPSDVNWVEIVERLRETLNQMDIFSQDEHDFKFEILISPREEVETILMEIAPYVQGHGGNIEVMEVDEASGRVVLSLQGACSGCPSSIATLKAGVERLLTDALPWVTSVEPYDEGREPDFGFHLD